MSSQATRSRKIITNVYETTPVTPEEHSRGYRGIRSRKIGTREATVELVVDLDKLIDKLSRKIQYGQTKATLADGAIVLKVVSRGPIAPLTTEQAATH